MNAFAKGRVLVALFGAAAVAFLGGCSGGGGGGDDFDPPVVVQTSPVSTFGLNPVETDPNLTQNTDPNFPGEIRVIFNSETFLDSASFFLAGDPSLGLDPLAVQIVRQTPAGQVLVDGTPVVEPTVFRFTPTAPLPAGQYSIHLFGNVKNIEGERLAQAPFSTGFTVGFDNIPPQVVVTSPISGALGVGAGTDPASSFPQQPGQGAVPASTITAIFGPPSPIVRITMSESMDASTVSLSTITMLDASAKPTPVPIAPAPGFPKVATGLPRNGFDIEIFPDPAVGGFPFGATVAVSVTGSDTGTAVADLSGNPLATTFTFQFTTIAPPALPQNPEITWAIWYADSEAIGAIDIIDQVGIGLTFLGAGGPPTPNVKPANSRNITNAQFLPNLNPGEISLDCRVSGLLVQSYAYTTSFLRNQVVITNTFDSMPIGLINTPGPAGISNQTGGGQAANMLVVTNASANTVTVFDISNLTPANNRATVVGGVIVVQPGTAFLSGPIFITNVIPTGNRPGPISISVQPGGNFFRDTVLTGPPNSIMLWGDVLDGTLNTASVFSTEPLNTMTLGTSARPNDISQMGCLFTPIGVWFSAIVTRGDGGVSHYRSGPGCASGGISAGNFPDAVIDTLFGFEAPAGAMNLTGLGNSTILGEWLVAESGSNTVAKVRVQGPGVSVTNLQLLARFTVGNNPQAVAIPPAFLSTPQLVFPPTNTALTYGGVTQIPLLDFSLAVQNEFYSADRGSGFVSVRSWVTGSQNFFSPVLVPGVKTVASTHTQ